MFTSTLIGVGKTIGRQRRRALHVLFAASGAAALIYQVLWLRALATLFGASAEAAAAVLAAFFLGLALGSELFGRQADRSRRPLRLYALLELGIAAGAALVPAVLLLYRSLYDGVYPALAQSPLLFAVFKMALTALALLPATLLMGGTLPALGRAVVSGGESLGRTGGRLYAFNVVGAVLGAVLATFGLPLWLGVHGTYAAAIGLTLAIAAAVAWIARDEPRREPTPAAALPPESSKESQPAIDSRRLLAIAFASGFATIGLEVLWTRMLALVFQNSVYSFGSVVAVFLVGLAMGAALVARLLRRIPAGRLLRISLLFTGLTVLLTPALLMWLTDGLQPFGGFGDFLLHSVSVIALTTGVILVPAVAAGMTLPCVWELWRGRAGAGIRLGRPTAANTVGAILGPLVAGFALLPAFGIGGSVSVIAVFYIVLGELVVPSSAVPRRGGWERAALYPVALIIFAVASPLSLPPAWLDAGERLIWADEGARGSVAVVEAGGNRRLKLDNHYAIGGSAVVVEERRQGHVPLLLHPRPRRVAFIGLGSGITAGAALAHEGVERVVVMELVPEVIEAARDHFAAWNAGVVDAERVTVVAEDGRNHLAGTDESFDVIVGDLFVPWREGVGALYTREHFENVKARLRPGGLFAQWIPLWQVSRREFDIIAATFVSVFDHVTLWRGVFSPAGASIALVAHQDGRSIDMPALERRLSRLRAVDSYEDGFLSELTGFMILYAGGLEPIAEQLAQVGLNTENRPRIEWLAPRTLRAVESGAASWLTGPELAELYDRINASPTVRADRYLVGSPLPPVAYRRAGAVFYSAEVAAAAGNLSRARELRRLAYAILQPSAPANP